MTPLPAPAQAQRSHAMTDLLTIDQLPSGSASLYTAEYLDGVHAGIGTADELREIANTGYFNCEPSELRFRLELAA